MARPLASDVMHSTMVSRCSAFALACAVASICTSGVRAGDYPDHPVRLVVPFPAGGSADTNARLLGQRLSSNLGQPIIIENRPGAGGNIGTDVVAKAAPDGYTLILGSISSHAINVSLYQRLPYDPVKDFAPISLMCTFPNVLVVNPAVPARNVQELIALAKAKPGSLTFASGGNGTTHHLSGELFKQMTGVDMTHVPYKGNAPAMTDLVGGQVQLMFDNIGNALPFIRAGKIRALAVIGPKRSPALPDVPTLAESGLTDYNVTSWFGILAPAKTPPPVLRKLEAAVAKALQDPSLRDQLARDGVELRPNSPAQFATFLQSEIVRWTALVRQSGAHID
ncbi:MAG: tripartite tricarboxylate transporter substrate binding protein [Betaproteobacteria bacterium]